MTLSIMTLSIMTLSIKTLAIMPISIITLNNDTQVIVVLIVTLSIKDTQHNKTHHKRHTA
jgi:hypothetical protein